ncbi:indolepyruvate ferredoxin oxidoreductase family protein [Sphaerotilus mobilis]|uniref:Indolepyruvate ferredoxin oxidoreductase n=1 Tax=Sphaerotilus mobilis TaxID=47994 RepID=A0A4Q7LRT3_9BURK|nr:indolepyruvate ferredoxin oxidoreductase family protein [Sphaerotilus mobilis]RZS56982.1 indolepyruvate ferredoxin oxidoreductase [Sphaerotilus mobilis]
MPTLARPDYRLADRYDAASGVVFLSGTQALLRLALTQRALDAARGWQTAGFISGYRGSPLGQLDQEASKAKDTLAAAGIRVLPAINEELGATQVLGSQRVESDPARRVDGVFGLWYGKGPGVDRAGDAIRHGNAYGSSPHGGVLVVAGDDHGCVSSSMPHQSDEVLMAWRLPVLQAADVSELIEFGLYGWALSRYSGAWVGLAALSEVVESSATVDLDAIHARVAGWADADAVAARSGHVAPADGLHLRWPDLPSLRLETRLADKLDAVRAFARINPIDREVIVSPQARVGIVSCGKAHADLMEVLRRLAITPDTLAAIGLRLYKVGLAWPVEPTRLTAFAEGLDEILVIEEKAGVVEGQLRELLDHAYAHRPERRPRLIGKRDAAGRPLLPAHGELRPSRLIEPVAHWLAAHFPDEPRLGDPRELLVHLRDFTPPALLHNAADAVRRLPYFCAGCPHNSSTVVPEGSHARAGIGCHFMANWMDRDTAGLIQMGGEGIDWIAHAPYTDTPHVFQNLGDGTYYHSGSLAIRQAVAASVATGVSITYKILFNDAVAMTGGQPVDGPISVDAIARQVDSEGVREVAVLSDDLSRYDGIRHRFPAGTTFHDRHELDAVQRRLREVRGVTVLIYEQTCAAEKRRRRKKGQMAAAPRLLHIHAPVCEGCGDCGVQSNCVALLPQETALGRKRRIDATACNQDERCADGFCPSFVALRGARLRRRVGAADGAARQALLDAVAALPDASAHDWNGAPWDLLVTGVGGTGVVTVGALVAMAAHLQGLRASVLDFMGFAQKGGAVLSFVRLAATPQALNQVRIDSQQADAVLACDLVVACAPEALQAVRHGRTRVLVNTHEVPVADSVRQPDAQLPVADLLAKLRHAAGDTQVRTFDAQALAEAGLGDTVTANVLALGHAWQMGLVPLELAALQQAIALNGVAVPANQLAFALGRLAAADPQACTRWLAGEATAPVGAPDREPERVPDHEPETLDGLLALGIAHLSAYQDRAWAQRYEARVRAVEQQERALGLDDTLPLSRAVARAVRPLMAVKDEYEVARLYSDPAFRQQLREHYEGEPGVDYRLDFLMAPPLLSRLGADGRAPRKLVLSDRWMRPLLSALQHGKVLRGRWFDPFGHSAERRADRALLHAFEARIDELLGGLAADAAPASAGAALDPASEGAAPDPAARRRRLALAVEIARLPQQVRGYGHVRAAQLAAAQQREAELLHRWDRRRYPLPARAQAATGQLAGIRVVSG